MKEPEAGTEVFSTNVVAGSANAVVPTGFAPDWLITAPPGMSGIGGHYSWTRLTGYNNAMRTNATTADTDYAPNGMEFDHGNKVIDNWYYPLTAMSRDVMYRAFKRAKGFFDVVAYTGTGSAHTENHSLGVVPEMILVKARDGTTGWAVYNADMGATDYGFLNTTVLFNTDPGVWNSTAPTDLVFSVGASSYTNWNTKNFIAYLFATLEGVSKVGSYTGTGSTDDSHIIDCGFSSGARFVLIKKSSDAGHWNVWDSVRGIVAGGADPYLHLNDANAETTALDDIEPHPTGFIINQEASDMNASSATYIFLAIA
jgi:hypothetical protein